MASILSGISEAELIILGVINSIVVMKKNVLMAIPSCELFQGKMLDLKL